MEMSTAELLFTARLRRGLTARELSTLSGVPQSTVSRIESGKMSPSYDIMRTLLATLGFESSDTLRPAVSNAPLVRFMDDYERGLIPDRTVLDRMRIAAQTSPILDRGGARKVSVGLAEVVEWARAEGVRFAISGLEGCSNETSLEPIIYLAAETSFASPEPGRRGSILLPLDEDVARFAGGGDLPTMSVAWALMDSIASPGRQSDVALDILEQYRTAELV